MKIFKHLLNVLIVLVIVMILGYFIYTAGQL